MKKFNELILKDNKIIVEFSCDKPASAKLYDVNIRTDVLLTVGYIKVHKIEGISSFLQHQTYKTLNDKRIVKLNLNLYDFSNSNILLCCAIGKCPVRNIKLTIYDEKHKNILGEYIIPQRQCRNSVTLVAEVSKSIDRWILAIIDKQYNNKTIMDFYNIAYKCYMDN